MPARVAPDGARSASTPLFRQIQPRGPMSIPIAGRISSDGIVAKKAGTYVRRGQILAEQWPALSAAPLAPANGRIVGMGTARITSRQSVPSILFDPDPDSTLPDVAPAVAQDGIAGMLNRLRNLDFGAGIDRLRQSGVWADRWTTPDLLGQLRSCVGRSIDTVMCDALDETPDLLLHSQIATAYPVELTAGVLALAALVRAEQVWAVLAAFGDPSSWDAMRQASAGTRLKLVSLEDHYPQSHPTLLIRELTTRRSRPVRLPTESGVLVIGATAAVAVGRCFLNHEPMLDVPAGMRDRARNKTHWLTVPIGMSWSQVLSQLSIPEAGLSLRAGNPIREARITTDCIISGGELSITASSAERFINPDPCIRCAWCVEGCPVNIQPAGLLEAAQQDDPYLAEQYGLDACIECGICSYVCPSNLPILGAIRTLRSSQGQGR